ncbi:MAG: Outer rane receptor for ferrienterochelin and colicin [Acidobacteria bacterium]|jgi:hypothetical protein|nr:Outer rane receptor for ferrienterochelin and colicin [Acidobacteriota bacterium]
MSKNFRFITLMLSLVLCLTASAFGQETGGEIQGTIRDPSGAVVPNLTITIRGVNVGINRTIQTDSEGFFRVRQLPPGTYTVATEAASGFAAQVKEGVQVALGNATTVDFDVNPTGIATTVDVTVDAGVIVDPTETKAQDNISVQEIERLPKGTGFTSLITTTSGVRAEPLSGQFSINGSTGPENSFIIDGQETQNFRTGQINANNDIPYQAVQEIQVKTSGFEAEFGGATGGVINAVTKSGSNQFRGEVGVQFVTQKLNATPRGIYNITTNANGVLGSTVPNSGQGIEFFPVTRDQGTTFFPTALLSGPIIKDKLWFFAIHAPRIINTQRPTTFVSGFGPTRTTSSVQTSNQKTVYNYDQIRLDASPFNNLRLSSSFTWNPIVDEGGLLSSTYTTGFRIATASQNFVIGSPSTLVVNGQTYRGAEAANFQGGRQNSNNFRFEGVFTPTSNLVIVGRYTRGFLNEKLASYGIPSGPDFRCTQVPANLEEQAGCTQGFLSGANLQTSRDISIRTTIDANASYLFNALGQHELKGGYQRSKILNDVFSGNVGPGRTYLYYGVNCFNPGFTYVQWQISPGTYPCPANSIGTGVTYQFGTVGRATNTADTFFIQDKWQPTSRLTFNLGLRTEQEKLPAFNENAQPLQFSFKDKLAPRLGVAYALTADGRTKISAFYGRFFDRLKFALPRGSFGGDFYHVSFFYITADRPNFSNYTVQNLKGNYNFTSGGACPITTGSSYVCDRDFRIPSNAEGASAFENGAVDPNVKPYRQSEATVEFQREVMRSTVFTARGLWRNLDQVIEDIGIPTAIGGEAFIIGNPGQGLAAELFQQLGYQKIPKAKRNYKALQLELDSRYISNFSFNFNYTLSRLYGNYSGLASPDEATAVTGVGRTTPNVNRDFDLPQVGFTASGEEALGLLPLDRTHVFKASGTYSFDWWANKSNTTDISFFTTAQSGTPRTTFVSIFGVPIPQTKRGDLGRTERYTQTDLNLTHRYRFGRDERFTLATDINVLNVFNENNVLAVNQNLHSNSFDLSIQDVNNCGENFVCSANFLTSNGVLNQYAAAEAGFAPSEAVFGVNAARNIAFGQPIVRQEPRTIRFGFRLLF